MAAGSDKFRVTMSASEGVVREDLCAGEGNIAPRRSLVMSFSAGTGSVSLTTAIATRPSLRPASAADLLRQSRRKPSSPSLNWTFSRSFDGGIQMSKPATLSAAQSDAVTPDGIMQLGFGFWGSRALLSAVELKLFGVLSEAGPLDAEQLRDRLGLHPRSARDFFDALVALGMLDRTDGRYRNTPQTDLFLDPAKPTYVGGVLEMSSVRLYNFWGSLTEALQTGQPQSEVKTGGEFF
jgi:hypothetical protein